MTATLEPIRYHSGGIIYDTKGRNLGHGWAIAKDYETSGRWRIIHLATGRWTHAFNPHDIIDNIGMLPEPPRGFEIAKGEALDARESEWRPWAEACLAMDKAACRVSPSPLVGTFAQMAASYRNKADEAERGAK